MKVILFIALLQLVILVTTKKLEKEYKWGNREKGDQHLFRRKISTEFPGEQRERYPQAGYQHNFRITRIEVRHYNAHYGVTERLTPGINSTYVHFRFESKEARALDIEYDIWGVYVGNCPS